tara:strand:- start:518 stop:733 length:216 start_codon:yes stop_codon:yes gene_type:complete
MLQFSFLYVGIHVVYLDGLSDGRKNEAIKTPIQKDRRNDVIIVANLDIIENWVFLSHFGPYRVAPLMASTD